jgi:hypothetical protein
MTPPTKAFWLAAAVAAVVAVSGGVLPDGGGLRCAGRDCPSPVFRPGHIGHIPETARIAAAAATVVVATAATAAARGLALRAVGAAAIAVNAALLGWLVAVAEKGLDARIVATHDALVGSWVGALTAAAVVSARRRRRTGGLK